MQWSALGNTQEYKPVNLQPRKHEKQGEFTRPEVRNTMN